MNKLIVFDLDETIVNGDTPSIWHEYCFEQGLITDPEFKAKNEIFMKEYYDGVLDLEDYIRYNTSALVNIPMDTLNGLLKGCVHNQIMPHVFSEARQKIKEYIDEYGVDNILIISATPTYIVRAVAAELGLTHAIGVDLAIEHERLTPTIIGVPSFKDGKVERLKQWLHEQEKERYYDSIRFYTDSINDLALCEYSDEVYAVNPCKLLRPIALERNWNILNWG